MQGDCGATLLSAPFPHAAGVPWTDLHRSKPLRIHPEKVEVEALGDGSRHFIPI